MAHTATTIEKKTKLLFLPSPLLVVSILVPAATLLMFLAFALVLLKLDNLTRARLTNALSEAADAADAGVVGIASKKAHKAEDNRLVEPLPLLPLWFSLDPVCKLGGSLTTPKHENKKD